MKFRDFLKQSKVDYIWPVIGPCVIFPISYLVTNMSLGQAILSFSAVLIFMLSLTTLSLYGTWRRLEGIERIREEGTLK